MFPVQDILPLPCVPLLQEVTHSDVNVRISMLTTHVRNGRCSE